MWGSTLFLYVLLCSVHYVYLVRRDLANTFLAVAIGPDPDVVQNGYWSGTSCAHAL